jgi:hypothetical protein
MRHIVRTGYLQVPNYFPYGHERQLQADGRTGEEEKGVFKIWERLKLALTSRGDRRGGKNPPTKRRISQLMIVPGASHRTCSTHSYCGKYTPLLPRVSYLSAADYRDAYYATCMLIMGAFFIHQAHLSSASAQRGCDSPDPTN